MDAENIVDALEKLRVKESVMVEEDSVYLAPFYHAESGVANRMALLIKTESMNVVSRIDESIAFLEKMEGINFAEKQKEAIRKAFTSKVMILTGGPGTGKTTTLMGIIELMEQLHRRVTAGSAHWTRFQATE